MKLCGFLSSILAVRLAAAYLVSPDGTAAPGANSDCSEWVQDSYALTCAIIEEIYGITEAQFEEWNPTVTEMGSGCTLLSGLYYCVQINYVSASSSLTSSITSKGQHAGSGTSTASVTTTSTPSTLTTVTVTTTTSSSSSSSTPTLTTATSTTSTTTGITTPTPYQTGMAANCDSFHLVVSGDTCDDIVTAADITLTEFYDWNPAVGSSCASLWLGYYVCIGVTTATATTTTTSSSSITTTSSAAVTTPTPYQTGMVTDCDLFHLVVSGDTCYDIAIAADITLDEFYDWNPDVGSTCASLWLGYYVCIGIEWVAMKDQINAIQSV